MDAARILFTQGNTLYQKSQYKLAIEKYKQCIEKGYYEKESLSNIGVCYEQLHDIPNAYLTYIVGKNKYNTSFDTNLQCLIGKTLPFPTILESIMAMFPSSYETNARASSLLVNAVMKSKHNGLFQLLKQSCAREQILQPLNPITLLHLGYLYYLGDENSQAITYLHQIPNPTIDVLHIIALCKLKLSYFSKTFLEDLTQFQSLSEKQKDPKWTLLWKDLVGCYKNANCISFAKEHWLDFNRETLVLNKPVRKLVIDWKETPLRNEGDKDAYFIELKNVSFQSYTLFDAGNVYTGEKGYTKFPFVSCKPSTNTIDIPVFYMFHTNVENYYHWNAECLTRYYDFLHTKPNMICQIAIPEQCPTFLTESLSFLGIDPKNILKVKDSTAYTCSSLFTVDYKETGESKDDIFHVYSPSMRSLRLLRSQFLANAERLKILQGENSSIVYVRRTTGIRSVENDQYLIDSLTKTYGGAFVVFEKGTFLEQARIFSKAKIVLGPHGAGLTNMLFCPDNTTIVEFPLKPNCNRCFEYMAKALSFQYVQIPEIQSYYYEKYSPSIADFDAVMRVLDSQLQMRSLPR